MRGAWAVTASVKRCSVKIPPQDLSEEAARSVNSRRNKKGACDPIGLGRGSLAEERKQEPSLTAMVNLLLSEESSVAADQAASSSERSPVKFSGDEVSR